MVTPIVPPSAECGPPKRMIGDRCIEPGVQDDGCPAGTLSTGSGCQAAGIPPELCAPGFVPAGDACEPILPSEPCPPGTMAIPGETRCRSVMPCAPGRWGDIPTDDTTEHVDASYTGGGSDGSATKPWTTINEAIAAVAPGAIVAIAAGTYTENVVVSGKVLRLWGVCPDSVEINGYPAVDLQLGANGSEVRGVAIVGAIRVETADALAENVWLHGSDGSGVMVGDANGPASLILRGSLVEQNQAHSVAVYSARVDIDTSLIRGEPTGGFDETPQGLWVIATTVPAQASITSSVVERARGCGICNRSSEVEVTGSVVRQILPNPTDNHGGEGIVAMSHESKPRARLTLRGAFIQEAHSSGVQVAGGEADIEALVVTSTLPRVVDGKLGRGLAMEAFEPDGEWDRSSGVVRSSVFEHNHSRGVFVRASEATLEGIVARDTQLAPGAPTESWGVEVDDDHAGPAVATIRGSIVENNHDIGLRLEGSDLTLQGSIVRGTKPRPSDQRTGYGILATGADGRLASAVMETSIVEANTAVGIVMLGTDAQLANVVVCGTLPRESDRFFGRGIDVHTDIFGNRSTLTARGLLVEKNLDVGFFVGNSDVTLEWSVVTDTAPRAGDGLFGDGIAALRATDPGAVITVVDSLVARSSRAGVSCFGAGCRIGSSVLDCNPLQLVAAPHQGKEATFENLGDVRCRCGDVEESCKVSSATLAPPQPIE